MTDKPKLIFYSGGNHAWGNERMHEAMQTLASGGRRSLTYIPSTHENGLKYYKRAKQRYRRYGFSKFNYFAVDAVFSRAEMRRALQSDVIYLAGGNTYYFLKHLKASGFDKQLLKFAKRGGIIAGLSAGALVLTPTIWLAGYPPHEGDLNEVRLKDLRGLNLVGFEFLPHYTGSGKTNKLMLKYSRQTRHPILACPDGSGLVVNGNSLTLLGPVYLFLKGQKTQLA